jgi:actin-like ATPase involved in cell morphogenesis
MSYSLGIDLGASTCAAALQRGAHVEPCALGETSTTMPAVALPRADGSSLVGEAAEQACRYEPVLVARSVTGRLADLEPIVVDDQLVDPYLLTEALIGTVVDRAGTMPGGPPDQLVLTYPLRLAGTVEPVLEAAAAQVSASPVVLVPEPIAALAKLSHDVELALGTTVAVVDFGGSSFDVTLVRRSATGFDLVGEPASIDDFGGVDVDTAVLAHVESAIGDLTSRIGPDDLSGMMALRRLRTSCRLAKEQLSSATEAVVDVAMPNARAHVEVTRDDFDRLITGRLTEAVDLVAATIADAGLAMSDVHVALVVGGSARIPLLSRLITDRVGLPIVADPLPELTVALGAALFGGQELDEAAAFAPAQHDAGDLHDPVPADDLGVQPLAGAVPFLAGPTAADDLVPPAPALDQVGWAPEPGPAPAPAPDEDEWARQAWDRPWEDSPRTSVFDDMPVAAIEQAIGHPPDGADDEFRQLTTSDTDPFGTRAGSLSGRLERRPADDDEDRDRKRFGKGFGDSTDPRVVVGAIGAGLAIVLLGGFAVVAATGGGGDPEVSVGNPPASTTSTSTTLSTTTTTAPSTTASTAAEETPPTTRRSTTTTSTTQPRATTTAPTAPPPTEPPPPPPTTEPPTTEPPTTSSTTSSTTTPQPP